MHKNTSKRRIGLIATAASLLIVSVLSFGGCAYFKEWRQLPVSKADEATIYVVSHGWHTGIVIDRGRLGDRLQFIPKQLGESAFYEFGWGEEDFYQAPENTVWLALQALLWVNDSTMHVVAVPSPPREYFPQGETVELKLSSAGHRELTDAIAASFARNSSAEPQSTRDGLYGESRFFDGTGRYFIVNTCNTWTARTLATAGVPMTEVLTLTAGGVMRQSRWAAAKYRCCAD